MKTSTRHSLSSALTVACALGLASAAPAKAAEPHHTVVLPDSAKWGPAPPSLPPGAQAVVLAGNPSVAAPFILRLKLPSGYTIPPHRHSTAERVTVISGAVNIGAGEKLDRSAGQTLPPAGFCEPASRHGALRLGRYRVDLTDQRHGPLRRGLCECGGRPAHTVAARPGTSGFVPTTDHADPPQSPNQSPQGETA